MRDNQERITSKVGHVAGSYRLKHHTKASRVLSCSRRLARLTVCVLVLTGAGVMVTAAQAGPERPSVGLKNDESPRPGVRQYGPQNDNRRYGPEAIDRRYGPRSDASSDSERSRLEERESTPSRVLPLESSEPPERPGTGGGTER
jgi:hypothetical protein